MKPLVYGWKVNTLNLDLVTGFVHIQQIDLTRERIADGEYLDLDCTLQASWFVVVCSRGTPSSLKVAAIPRGKSPSKAKHSHRIQINW